MNVEFELIPITSYFDSELVSVSNQSIDMSTKLILFIGIKSNENWKEF